MDEINLFFSSKHAIMKHSMGAESPGGLFCWDRSAGGGFFMNLLSEGDAKDYYI